MIHPQRCGVQCTHIFINNNTQNKNKGTKLTNLVLGGRIFLYSLHWFIAYAFVSGLHTLSLLSGLQTLHIW